METPEIKNIFSPSAAPTMPYGMGGGDGLGFGGGGGLGALLAVALLGGGNGGLLGGRNGGNVEGIVTPALLAASLAQVTDTAQATSTMQTLGDIKASVPLAEGQVQLALAGQASQLMAQMNTNALASLTTSGDIRRDIAAVNAVNIAGFGQVNQNIANGTFAITSAVRDDGDKTRALIVSQNDAMLNRELATAQAALLEQRAIGRSREVEVNVTQTVNQNQVQLQTQQQQQQQIILLAQVAAALGGLQNAVATNSNLIVGNSGPTTTGAQTANPVNVRT